MKREKWDWLPVTIRRDVVYTVVVFFIWFSVSGLVGISLGPEVPEAAPGGDTGPAADYITIADKLAAAQAQEGEDPDEGEKIEKALLENGYLSDAVPLSYDMQDVARTACERYRVPYALALAVIECESAFDEEAVGEDGYDHGLMQIRESNFDWLREETGAEPTAPEGNLVCGIYMLGDLLEKYSDGTDRGVHKALMAYNLGPSGAAGEWEKGHYKSDYSIKVMEVNEKWESVVG